MLKGGAWRFAVCRRKQAVVLLLSHVLNEWRGRMRRGVFLLNCKKAAPKVEYTDPPVL